MFLTVAVIIEALQYKHYRELRYVWLDRKFCRHILGICCTPCHCCSVNAFLVEKCMNFVKPCIDNFLPGDVFSYILFL